MLVIVFDGWCYCSKWGGMGEVKGFNVSIDKRKIKLIIFAVCIRAMVFYHMIEINVAKEMHFHCGWVGGIFESRINLCFTKTNI